MYPPRSMSASGCHTEERLIDRTDSTRPPLRDHGDLSLQRRASGYWNARVDEVLATTRVLVVVAVEAHALVGPSKLRAADSTRCRNSRRWAAARIDGPRRREATR